MDNNVQKFPIVFVKCRRGNDAATVGQECSSMQAHNMSIFGDSVVRFKCLKCGFIWVVPVGGQMVLPPGV